MKLYIYTLSYNGKDKLLHLYSSLKHQINGLDCRWYIKDNGSSDGTIEAIQALNDKRIICIAYPNNTQNYSQGMNYIHEIAKPERDSYILFLNNDTSFDNNKCISNMLKIINKDNSIGIVGPRIMYPDRRNTIQQAGVIITKLGTPTHYRSGQTVGQLDRKNREFQALTGAILLTRADYFESVGLYDTQFNWCFEDIDLNLKIKYGLDKKIVFCGDCTAYHEESATLKKMPFNKMYMMDNVYKFVNKWNGKMVIDQDLYAINPNHNLYTGK
jgi:GT2 family glycosyltransferase